MLDCLLRARETQSAAIFPCPSIHRYPITDRFPSMCVVLSSAEVWAGVPAGKNQCFRATLRGMHIIRTLPHLPRSLGRVPLRRSSGCAPEAAWCAERTSRGIPLCADRRSETPAPPPPRRLRSTEGARMRGGGWTILFTKGRGVVRSFAIRANPGLGKTWDGVFDKWGEIR